MSMSLISELTCRENCGMNRSDATLYVFTSLRLIRLLVNALTLKVSGLMVSFI